MRESGEGQAALEKYGDMLYRLCLILLRSRCDAEDAVQETMLRLVQKAPVFRDAEHEKAWLIRVATNRCRDMLRYRARHPQVGGAAPEVFAAETESHGALEALASLPDKYRIAMTLHYVQGLSVAQIARLIGRTPSAVKMRLKKGREMLEEIYRREYL